MLERLSVRPELAAFDNLLRERVDRLALVEDERIARPRWIDRDPDGALVVVSEFVPGSRLSDLLDASADQGAAPGLDVAFGYLLDVLPALCGLHAGAGFAHGTIAPSRTVLTPAGQVVLLDAIYGEALSLLRFSRKKLWLDFGVALPASAGAPRLDAMTDVSQVVLAGVMLIVGRPLYQDEFPDALPRIIADVVDISQIRAGSEFANQFHAFLQRTLPFSTRTSYGAADDALIDLRALASQLGLEACRRALVEFIEQMEPSGNQPVAEPAFDDVLSDIENFGRLEILDIPDDDPDADNLDDDDEMEIELEELVEEPSSQGGLGDEGSGGAADPHAPTGHPEPGLTANRGAAPDGTSASSTHPAPAQPPSAEQGEPASSVRSKRAKRTRSARARKDKLRSAATSTPLATQATAATPKDALVDETAAPGSDTDGDRQERISPARAAKAERPKPVEHLEPPREPVKTVPDEPTPPPEKAANENWLVQPGRAEAFEPAIPEPPPIVPIMQRPIMPAVTPPAGAAPPAAIPFRPVAPPVTATPLTPYAAVPPPQGAPIPVPTFAAPPAWAPAPVTPPPMPAAPTIAPVTPLKLKDTAPKPRAVRVPTPADDIYGTPLPSAQNTNSSSFPWKLAVAALVAVAILVAAGRYFLGGNSAAGEEPAATSAAADTHAGDPGSASRPRANTPPRANPAAAAAGAPAAPATGRLEIETQPTGAQILLDSKAVGTSPLTLDSVPAGRHTVTATTASGSVKRTIRVESGRTLKMDVPIFSGWVGVFAPFVVVVSEGDRVIGTTEESRVMLSPGRHVLTLTNRELGYKAVETVDIEPGEVRTLTLDPRGTVNLNASPWAEVWIDGKKAGDTPLAGLQLPLGTQELTFRHPQHGERKVSVTVKGNQPAALSVNMVK